MQITKSLRKLSKLVKMGKDEYECQLNTENTKILCNTRNINFNDNKSLL